jgi:hypothetical protein
MTTGFFLDAFTETQSVDGEGMEVTLRERHVGKSKEGQPIFPGRGVSAIDFCEQFISDSMTESEWKTVLKKCKPDLDMERAISGDDAQRKAQAAADAEEVKQLPKNLAKALALILAPRAGEL